MGLMQGLMSIGGKLGIVRIVSTTASAQPGKIPTRKVTLSELALEIRSDEVRRLTQAPQELAIDFAKVFEAAGIKTPGHGWDVEHLAKALSCEPLAGKDRAGVQKALLEMLSHDGAHVHEIVQDAMARDQALDAFEEFAHKKLADRQSLRQQQQAQIDNQIKELQERRAVLEQEMDEERKRWKTWHDGKIGAEKRMAEALSFLVQDSVISVDHDHP